jgi:hypothetical protein
MLEDVLAVKMPEMFALYIFRLILALGYCLAPNIVLNNQGFLD